jgi:hypothetical protein
MIKCLVEATLTVVSDDWGVILIERVPEGHIVNQKYHPEVLTELRTSEVENAGTVGEQIVDSASTERANSQNPHVKQFYPISGHPCRNIPPPPPAIFAGFSPF